jgi:hypothetical protein
VHGTISVAVIGDTPREEDETFVVNLSNPVGATMADGEAQGTIQNDDRRKGCGAGVEPANLIAFYVLCWAGLAGVKWARRADGKARP